MVIGAEDVFLNVEAGGVDVDYEKALWAAHLGGGSGNAVRWVVGLRLVLRNVDVACEDEVGSGGSEG